MRNFYAQSIAYFFLIFLNLYGCSDIDFDKQISTDIETVSLNDAWIIDPYRFTPEYRFTLTNKNIFQIPAAETTLNSDAEIVKYHVSIQRLTYTTTYGDHPVTASGLIIIPIDTGNVHSILSYQHSSIFAEKEVPSYAIDSLETLTTFHLLPPLILAANGYITFVPDLIGHGASSSYLYPDHLDQPAADAVVDMLIAGRKFLQENDIPFDQNKLFLAGYSEGGYVTMAAQKAIEENPELGFHLTASAPGGASFNLNIGVPELIDSDYLTFPNIFCRRIAAWNEYYWQRPLTDFFRQPYADNIGWIFDGDLGFDETNSYLTTNTYQLLSPEFVERFVDGDEEELIAALTTNSVNYWKPETPTMIYNGTLDNFKISQEEYSIFVNDFHADADVVQLVPIEDKDHLSAAYPYLASVIEWFQTFE